MKIITLLQKKNQFKNLKHEQLTGFTSKATIKGMEDKIKIVLENIPGIIGVQVKAKPAPDIVTFLISSEDDIRSIINKEIINAGFDILEITATEESMEDIFHKLTK